MNAGTKRIFKKFFQINTSRMKKTVEVIKKNSGHCKFYIYSSMAWNFLRYGVGYTDYFRGNFIDRTRKEKKTYVTAKTFYNIIHHFNDQDYVKYFTDKLTFNEHFKSYLGREFLNLKTATEEEFKDFIGKYPVVFAKDPHGEGGKGITRIVTSEIDDPTALLAQLKEKKQFDLEEGIVQCQELNMINPNVVNSFRIVTLVHNGRAHILNNSLRMNQGKDQIIGSSGDVYCCFGADGKVDGNVVDDFGNTYDVHPLTGLKFSEFTMPWITEAFEMCKEAALVVPQMRYIGWDVAFSKDGPLIVEGNEYPGYGLFQYYLLKGSRTGHLEEIRQVVGDQEIKSIKRA